MFIHSPILRHRVAPLLFDFLGIFEPLIVLLDLLKTCGAINGSENMPIA